MVLLVLRRADDLWASPGGFIDPGETAEEAALREGFEETLIDISAYNPRMISVYQGPVADPRATANAWPSTSAFAVHLDADLTKDLPLGMFAGNPDEVKAAGWFTLAQAAELDMFGSHKPLLSLGAQTL
jgi:8-oxo-dGTP diphosphatase